MARSALAQAYFDLLSAMEDERTGVASVMADEDRSMLENAKALCQTYEEAPDAEIEGVHERMRQNLADLVVWINENRPDMVGTHEAQRALDLLSRGASALPATKYVPLDRHNAPAAPLTDEGNAEARTRAEERIQKDQEDRERVERERTERTDLLQREQEQHQGDR